MAVADEGTEVRDLASGTTPVIRLRWVDELVVEPVSVLCHANMMSDGVTMRESRSAPCEKRAMPDGRPHL